MCNWITFCTPETNTTLLINYTPIKFLKSEGSTDGPVHVGDMHTVLGVICTFWQTGSIPETSGMSGRLWQVPPGGHKTLPPSRPEHRETTLPSLPCSSVGSCDWVLAPWKVVDVMYTAFRPSPYTPSLFPAGCGDPRKDYKSQGSPYSKGDPAALASPRSLPEVQMLRPTSGLTRSEPSF